MLFTYLLSYGGAVVSLIQPRVGLLIYVAFAILKPEFLWYWSVSQGGNYSRIIAIGMLLGWALHGFGDWRLGRAGLIVAAAVGFLAWGVLGVAMAQQPGLAWERVDVIAKIILPFLVGITTIRTLRHVQELAWVILLSQAYLAIEMHRIYLAGAFIPTEFAFANQDNNGLAVSFVIASSMALFLAWSSWQWSRKAIALASGLLMVHVVLFSMSRGAILALIVSTSVAFVIVRKRLGHYLGFACTVAIVLALAGTGVRERFATVFASSDNRDRSANSRLLFWSVCLEQIKEHPVLGVGPNHWPLVAVRNGLPSMAVHSTWLEVCVEYGCPGGLLLFTIFLVPVVRLLKLAREEENAAGPIVPAFAQMVITGVVGFIVAAQFLTFYLLEMPYYLVLVGASILKLRSIEEMADASLASAEEGESYVSAG
jgi:O-antigen ligase